MTPRLDPNFASPQIQIIGQKTPVGSIQLEYIQNIHKISSIKALHIELIADKIAQKLLQNLGPISKSKIAQLVQQETRNDLHQRLTLLLEKRAITEGREQFLTDEEAKRFIDTALNILKEKLTDAFSKPIEFLESGAFFKMSDYWPMGVLKETATALGLQLTLNDVPIKYFIELKLDKELPPKSEPEFDLVFVLSESSELVKFSTETFTINIKY